MYAPQKCANGVQAPFAIQRVPAHDGPIAVLQPPSIFTSGNGAFGWPFFLLAQRDPFLNEHLRGALSLTGQLQDRRIMKRVWETQRTMASAVSVDWTSALPPHLSHQGFLPGIAPLTISLP